MPSWVNAAVAEFQKRLQEFSEFKLIEIPLIQRSNPHETTKILTKEHDQLLKAIPQGSYIIALDKNGKTFSSENLATKLSQLQLQTSHICFLIGGPEGFIPETLKIANEQWSLSTLTLPHMLARIVLVEAIYRGFSIIVNHPYHK